MNRQHPPNNQMFSMFDRSGDRAGQDNNRIPSASRKRPPHATSGVVLSCWKMVFGRLQIQGKATAPKG
ncbi:hypothetical protein TNCV_3101061 [Trichonephila clavipes]|nr:hypothetical protein TNCV_3101061 [Trichonephila clavipes]